MSWFVRTKAAHQPATIKLSNCHVIIRGSEDTFYSQKLHLFFLGKFLNMIAFFTLCWVRLSQNQWKRTYFDIHKMANMYGHSIQRYSPITSSLTWCDCQVWAVWHMMVLCLGHISSSVCHQDRVEMLMVGLVAWSCEKVSKDISASINFEKRDKVCLHNVSLFIPGDYLCDGEVLQGDGYEGVGGYLDNLVPDIPWTSSEVSCCQKCVVIILRKHRLTTPTFNTNTIMVSVDLQQKIF